MYVSSRRVFAFTSGPWPLAKMLFEAFCLLFSLNQGAKYRERQMIFQGVAPSFTSAIADDYGRRPAYLLGFIVFVSPRPSISSLPTTFILSEDVIRALLSEIPVQ